MGPLESDTTGVMVTATVSRYESSTGRKPEEDKPF